MLVEEASDPDALDLASLKEKLSEAESAISEADEGSEAQSKARRDKRRWETFISIAEGGAS